MPGDRGDGPARSETRVDPHVKVLDGDVVARAKARGLDALVYAPHFTRLPAVERRAARFADEDLLVVPARELFTGSWRNRKHVLALGLDEPVPDFLTLEATMAELARQDATVLVPHPEFLTVSLDAGDVARFRDVLDAVEVYNPKHRRWDNRRARAIARESDLPTVGSSYAHLRGTVGEVWTALDAAVADGDDLAAALAGDVSRRVEHRSGRRHRLRCHAEFAHLAWENTWTKVARIAGPGRAATHPAQPTYGGRFDDVTAY
ncbi:MAG: PHP-associated domain-containing protein [Halobacteriaceae archaeon]